MPQPARFSEPAGFHWSSFKNAKGADIRFGHVAPEGPLKGTVVIVGGFKEPIEKYHEVTADMLSRGYAVWLMDWRGQGGSSRYIPHSEKAHHEGYDEQIETLHRFMTSVVDTKNQPVHLMAHSMGAHTGLRYLKEHPGVFDSAMITAPMFDISTGAIPKPLARQMAKFAKTGNYLDKYVPGGADWQENKEDILKNHLTSDPRRFEMIKALFQDNPQLRLGDPTYGWVWHTFQSIDVLSQEDYLKSIKTPILMEISGNEKVVIRAASERASQLLPDCRRVDIDEARHEIWMERDSLRMRWLAAVDQFMQERRAAHLSAKKCAPTKPPAA